MKINCFLLGLSILFTGCVKTDKKIENIRTFAKLNEYVRWFYTGDEAAMMDLDKFAVYGNEYMVME
jgi:hypothetical protein